MEVLSLIIKDLSQKTGISIRKLCKKIDVTESGLSRSIKNKVIKVETLKKIAQVYNVPMSYFFEGSNTTELQVNYNCLKSDYEQLIVEHQQLKDRIIELQAQLIEKLTK